LINKKKIKKINNNITIKILNSIIFKLKNKIAPNKKEHDKISENLEKKETPK
jgi:hypothetical protein